MPAITISQELNAQFEKGEQYPPLAVETLQARQKLLADAEKLLTQDVTPEVFWKFFSQARALTSEWNTETWASMIGMTTSAIDRWSTKSSTPHRAVFLTIMRHIVPS